MKNFVRYYLGLIAKTRGQSKSHFSREIGKVGFIWTFDFIHLRRKNWVRYHNLILEYQ